jgi:hypothetical protein
MVSEEAYSSLTMKKEANYSTETSFTHNTLHDITLQKTDVFIATNIELRPQFDSRNGCTTLLFNSRFIVSSLFRERMRTDPPPPRIRPSSSYHPSRIRPVPIQVINSFVALSKSSKGI